MSLNLYFNKWCIQDKYVINRLKPLKLLTYIQYHLSDSIIQKVLPLIDIETGRHILIAALKNGCANLLNLIKRLESSESQETELKFKKTKLSTDRFAATINSVILTKIFQYLSPTSDLLGSCYFVNWNWLSVVTNPISCPKWSNFTPRSMEQLDSVAPFWLSKIRSIKFDSKHDEKSCLEKYLTNEMNDQSLLRQVYICFRKGNNFAEIFPKKFLSQLNLITDLKYTSTFICHDLSIYTNHPNLTKLSIITQTAKSYFREGVHNNAVTYTVPPQILDLTLITSSPYAFEDHTPVIDLMNATNLTHLVTNGFDLFNFNRCKSMVSAEIQGNYECLDFDFLETHHNLTNLCIRDSEIPNDSNYYTISAQIKRLTISDCQIVGNTFDFAIATNLQHLEITDSKVLNLLTVATTLTSIVFDQIKEPVDLQYYFDHSISFKFNSCSDVKVPECLHIILMALTSKNKTSEDDIVSMKMEWRSNNDDKLKGQKLKGQLLHCQINPTTMKESSLKVDLLGEYIYKFNYLCNYINL